MSFSNWEAGWKIVLHSQTLFAADLGIAEIRSGNQFCPFIIVEKIAFLIARKSRILWPYKSHGLRGSSEIAESRKGTAGTFFFFFRKEPPHASRPSHSDFLILIEPSPSVAHSQGWQNLL